MKRPKHFRSRKGDISFNLIIAIVIGLIILAISVYLLYGRSKDVQEAGTCDALGGDCVKYKVDCDPGYGSSLTPCKTDPKLKTFDGRCCLPE